MESEVKTGEKWQKNRRKCKENSWKNSIHFVNIPFSFYKNYYKEKFEEGHFKAN